MDIKELEKCFTRAFLLSFSKKKCLIVFPVLVICGVFFVFFRTLAIEASGWISMSLLFLPILFSLGILLSLGVLLIRMYYHEVKGLSFSFRKLIRDSWPVVLGTFYLSIPSILVYFLLWILLGVFVLLKEIPAIGSFIGVILAFGPFLLILSSLLLCIFNVGLLFFATPWVALNAIDNLSSVIAFMNRIKEKIFSHFLFFFVGLLPIGCVGFLLSFAAILTNVSYLVGQHTLSIAMKWFFIMLPFSAFLTPALIFFFNFAAEAYNLLYKKKHDY